MNKTIKDSMREILFKFLYDFRNEPDKDVSTMQHYVDKFVDDFERYLSAYKDFKED